MISTEEDPALRDGSFSIINIRGVSKSKPNIRFRHAKNKDLNTPLHCFSFCLSNGIQQHEEHSGTQGHHRVCKQHPREVR